MNMNDVSDALNKLKILQVYYPISKICNFQYS